MSANAIKLPEESMDAMVVAPYLNSSKPPDSVIEKLAQPKFVALVAFVAKATDWLPMLLLVMNEPPDAGFVAFVAFVTAVVPIAATISAADAADNALVPLPRRRLPDVKDDAPVPPSATAKSVMPVMEPPVIDTLFAACVAMVPRPRLIRAPEASEAPVPPSAMAKSVMPVIEPPVIETPAAF